MSDKTFSPGDLVEFREKDRSHYLIVDVLRSLTVPAGEQLIILSLEETSFTCPRVGFTEHNLLAKVLSSVGIGSVNTNRLRKTADATEEK